MSYRTVNELYWGLAILIVAGIIIVAVLGVSILWLRSRRFAHHRAVRLARIARFREDRPPYDPDAWNEAAIAAYALTFGLHGDALAEIVSDARQAEPKQRQSEPIRLVTV